MHTRNVDMLDRNGIIDKLIHIVDTVGEMQNKNIAMALTGPWGCGKTFILKEMEKRLENRNHSRRGQAGYLVFHYNCWQHDYYDEPLIAIVSALTEGLEEHSTKLSQDEKHCLKNSLAVTGYVFRYILVNLLEAKLGVERGTIQDMVDGIKETWKGMADQLEGDYKFDPLTPFNSAISLTIQALKEASKEHTIVMVVDELDRCMPSYSIKVIERLHHLFEELTNCVVILAVDKQQMDRTVKGIFGANTNTDSYLRKFIHFEFPVETARITGSFQKKYRSYMSLFRLDDSGFVSFSLDEFLAELFRNIDMRMQERIMERLELVHRICFGVDHRESMDMFLFEVTAAVFMCYEKGHTKECEWETLEKMPFVADKNSCCGVIYSDMTSFNRHLQRHWGYTDCVEKNMKQGRQLRYVRPEARCLLASWQLYYNDPVGAGAEWWHYEVDRPPQFRERLVEFVECLKEHW